MRSLLLTLLLFTGVETQPQKGERWRRPDERIDCGPMTLEVYVSRTAHLFHVVDQISEWDNACHGQYRANMSLSSGDEEQLARYKEVRVKRRWGQGLEQTFYTPLELEQAARAGRKAGHITSEELEVILPVLEHFAPRVEELMESKREILEQAFAQIDRERFTQAAQELSRFTGVKKLSVPVFPLASPAPGGGGMDGGRLRWELNSDKLSFSVLLHELTHAFFMQKNDLLRAVVEQTPGLTMTLLGEGFAYAMAPGLYPDGRGDQLAYNVARDRQKGEAWGDPGYGRQRTYALALRPLFREALSDSTLEEFLPRTRDVFLAMREVFEASTDAPGTGPPKLLIAGPAAADVRERLLDTKYHLWIQRVNHAGPKYDEFLPKLGDGDLFVMLLAGDDAERIPATHLSLSPVDPETIERQLTRGKTIAEQARAREGYRIVLLAAPTLELLEELARSTTLLDV